MVYNYGKLHEIRIYTGGVEPNLLMTICNAPWFISKGKIHEDRKINTVKQEVPKSSAKYMNKLETHPKTTRIY